MEKGLTYVMYEEFLSIIRKNINAAWDYFNPKEENLGAGNQPVLAFCSLTQK